MKKLLLLLWFLYIGIHILFAQQTVVSEDRIPVDWSSRNASAIKEEVMNEVFSHLSRYEYYFVDFGTNDNSATSFWRNEVIFQTRQNPSSIWITMYFNYFWIRFSFSNQQLVRDGVDFSESWFRGFVAQNRFRRETNEVLNRISLRMRGMTFGSNSRHETDRRWLEALRLPLR